MRYDCIHLIEPTDESVREKCNTCTARVLLSVWYCSKHDKCTPFARFEFHEEVKEVTNCKFCNDYRSSEMKCELISAGRGTYKCKICGTSYMTVFPHKINIPCIGQSVEPKESEPDLVENENVQSKSPKKGNGLRLFGH